MEIQEVVVLLVEDIANTRASLKAMLQEMGINQIYEVSDGAEAVAFIATGATPVNLIISDWNMPNKTGLELLQEIRKTHADMPFLMITARADEASVHDAKESKVTAYIRKPFSLAELQKKVLYVTQKA